MHYSRALINGHAAWWFDMWGGWYDDPDYMKFMSNAMDITKKSLDLSSESVAEVAVFVDEDSFGKNNDNDIGIAVVNRTKRALGLIGTPRDMFLTSDFDSVKDRYKAYISLVPTETEGSVAIKEYAKVNGIPLFEITLKNADVTSKELREFCKKAGVFIYSDRDAVIYANRSYVFIHTGEDGEQVLSVPDAKGLYDIFSDKEFSQEFTAPIGKSYLLRKTK